MGKYTVVLLLALSLVLAGELTYDSAKTNGLINQKNGLSYAENPAMINFEDASFSYVNREASDSLIKSQNFSLSLPIGRNHIGFTLQTDSLSNLNKTMLANDGSFSVAEHYDHMKLSSIVSFGSALLSDDFYYGVNWKLYYQSIGEKSMMANGFDLGFSYSFSSCLSIGLSCDNVGGTVLNWGNNIEDTIPQNFATHVSYQEDDFYVTAIHKMNSNDMNVRSGITFFDFLSLSVSTPLQNMQNSKVSMMVSFDSMDFGYSMDFNEAFGNNAQFFFSLDL